MDEEGLDPDALEAELRRGGDVSFLYTIPTFQNPSGRTLGEERRRRIAELAASFDLDVLEDDPYGLRPLRGRARRPRCTPSRAASGSRSRRPSRRPSRPGCGSAGSSSRRRSAPPSTTAPSRRTSRRRCSPRRSCTSCSRAARSSRTSSASAGSFAPSATRCSPRSTAELHGRATWSRPRAATSCGSTSPEGVDAGELLGRATEAGVTFVRGLRLLPRRAAARASARLAFSYEPPERIVEGVGLLAGLL